MCRHFGPDTTPTSGASPKSFPVQLISYIVPATSRLRRADGDRGWRRADDHRGRDPGVRPGHPDGDGRLTFGALDERASRLANHLLGQGVRAGERVAVLLGNRLEYPEIAAGI